MIPVVKKWFLRIFSNEEATLLIFLLAAALALIMLWGSTLAPLIIAIVAAFLLQGAVNRLTEFGCPYAVSVTLVWCFAFGVFVLSLVFLVPLLWNQSVNLLSESPRMIEELRKLALELNTAYPQLITEEAIITGANMARQHLQEFGEWIITYSLANIVGLASLFVYSFLVPILVLFLLKDKNQILGWISKFLPAERPFMNALWLEMNLQVANYVRGKFIEIGIVASVCYVVFQLLGVNYAELLAILVGVSVLIPFIGAAVATIPVLLVGFFQWGGGAELFYLGIAYAIIQALDGNLLVPILFSETVNLHPVAIILAVVFFGGVWGFWGVFFAIPLATLVKALIDAWPTHKQEVLEKY